MRPAPRKVPPSIQAEIDRWIERNGGARRFERGASNDFTSINHYIGRHGYSALFPKSGEVVVHTPTGKPSRMPFRRFMEFVDGLRSAEGLEPMLPPEASS